MVIVTGTGQRFDTHCVLETLYAGGLKLFNPV